MDFPRLQSETFPGMLKNFNFFLEIHNKFSMSTKAWLSNVRTRFAVSSSFEGCHFGIFTYDTASWLRTIQKLLVMVPCHTSRCQSDNPGLMNRLSLGLSLWHLSFWSTTEIWKFEFRNSKKKTQIPSWTCPKTLGNYAQRVRAGVPCPLKFSFQQFIVTFF